MCKRISLALISVLAVIMLVSGCNRGLKQKDKDHSMAPSKVNRCVANDRSLLENAVIRGEWKLDDGQAASLTVKNKHTAQTVTIGSGHLPHIVLNSGRTIDLASVRLAVPLHLDKHSIVAAFEDNGAGLAMRWSATLDDSANAIIQTLQSNKTP